MGCERRGIGRLDDQDGGSVRFRRWRGDEELQALVLNAGESYLVPEGQVIERDALTGKTRAEAGHAVSLLATESGQLVLQHAWPDPPTDAETAYAQRCRAVAQLLDWLKLEVKQHAAHAAKEGISYGHAGDLGHVQERLMQTLAFLSQREESDIAEMLAPLWARQRASSRRPDTTKGTKNGRVT